MKEKGRRKYMHVTVGIRKWGGGRGRSPQRDVRRRDRYAGVYGSRPLRFGPLLRAPFFFFCSFTRSSHETHIGTLEHHCPPSREEDSLASRSGRVSDCVITGSHTGAESLVGRRDPPAFNERHFSSFSIQPVWVISPGYAFYPRPQSFDLL